jgi:hypothetical protein
VKLCHYTEFSAEKVCSQVPVPEDNAVFIVDLRKVHYRDLSCDSSGIYGYHSSPSTVVSVTEENGKLKHVNIISRKKLPGPNPTQNRPGVLLMKRHYAHRKQGNEITCKRMISTAEINGEMCRYAVVQYLGTFFNSTRPHANSKRKNSPYIRVKPSTMDRIKELSKNDAPKEVINIIDKDIGFPHNVQSISDGVRDRRQVYNAKKRVGNAKSFRNTGKIPDANFSKLIADMDTGKFVKCVEFGKQESGEGIKPLTFAATDNCLDWMRQFCTPKSQVRAPVHIDMTYKVGPFYTTCLSFAHPMFVHKNMPDVHPTALLGLMTSTYRRAADYRFLANSLQNKCTTELIYGTDGELALEKAFEDVFPIKDVSEEKKSIHLRCYTHVESDLMAELKQHGYSKKQSKDIVTSLLGSEYEGIRKLGLVDSKSDTFPLLYTQLSSNWKPQFKEYMETTAGRIRPLRDTLQLCMGKDVRTAAGLGDPPNKFTNQRAEAINRVVKECIGKVVDQSTVHDLVYEKVVLQQEREFMKAIYGGGEYRLAETYKHLEISPLRWNRMNPDQRQRQIKKIFKDVLVENKVSLTNPKLQLQPDECHAILDQLPLTVVNNLWSKAESLLGNDHIRELKNGNFCIAESDTSVVVQNEDNKFKCQCQQFNKLGICSHVLVVADIQNVLHQLTADYVYDPSQAINRQQPKGAGEKRNKKPRRGQQNVVSRPIEKCVGQSSQYDHINLDVPRQFQASEVWHNGNPFRIVSLKEVMNKRPKNKQFLHCPSCKSDLSINIVCPYDIVVEHEERYYYPNNDGNYVPTHSRTMKKYYCIKRSCLLERHPYFWNGLIRINTDINYMHKKLLRDCFNYNAM